MINITGIEDTHDVDTIEIKVVKHGDTYRVWVNGPNGLLFRAYNVKTLLLDIDDKAKALLR